MYTAIILPTAKADIKDAAQWYNHQHQGLGKRFTAQVRDKINVIRKNPMAYSCRYLNVHTAVVDVFPFMIHFRINVERRKLLIISVLHTSQNPQRWDR